MSLLLLASALTQSTMGLLIPRGWIVLSDKGKKFGADVVVKELGNWLRLWMRFPSPQRASCYREQAKREKGYQPGRKDLRQNTTCQTNNRGIGGMICQINDEDIGESLILTVRGIIQLQSLTADTLTFRRNARFTDWQGSSCCPCFTHKPLHRHLIIWLRVNKNRQHDKPTQHESLKI